MITLKDLKNIWHYRRELKLAMRTQLSFLSSDGTLEALGGLTEEELQALISWLPAKGVFVEFGTLFGLTAKAVAAARPELKIIAVDNFSWNPFGLSPTLHEAFTRQILASEIMGGRVEVFSGTSEAFRKACKTVPDAVFFDAQHQYEPVKEEIDWAKKVGVKVIAGHDYGNPSPVFGVTRAVDEAFPNGIHIAGMCWASISTN